MSIKSKVKKIKNLKAKGQKGQKSTRPHIQKFICTKDQMSKSPSVQKIKCQRDHRSGDHLSRDHNSIYRKFNSTFNNSVQHWPFKINFCIEKIPLLSVKSLVMVRLWFGGFGYGQAFGSAEPKTRSSLDHYDEYILYF